MVVADATMQDATMQERGEDGGNASVATAGLVSVHTGRLQERVALSRVSPIHQESSLGL